MRGTMCGYSSLLALMLSSQPLIGSAKVAPIITTDVIYGTGGLMMDMYGMVWTTYAAPHANKIWAEAKSSVMKAVPPDPVGFACTKIGCDKAVIESKVNEATTTAMQMKATMYEKSAELYAPLNNGVGLLVDQFEQALPEYAGAIPRPLGDFVVFMIYIFLFMYVVTCIALFAFKTVLKIYCFFCCCGCCRRGGASKKAEDAAKKGDKKSDSKDAKAAPKKPANGNANGNKKK